MANGDLVRTTVRALALAALTLATRTLPGTTQDAPDRSEILAAVDRYFAAMKTRDTAAMASVSLPGGMTAVARYDGTGVRIMGGPSAASRARLAAMAEGPTERLLAAEVWQDGEIAAVWAPYEIRQGNQLLHCGYDAFALARSDGRWRIANSTYTVRPEGCPAIRAAAAGPPPLPGPTVDERRAVLAPVDSFFAALKRRDTTLLGTVFTSRANWVTASYRNGQATVGRRPASEDAAIVARATAVLDERLLDAVVRIDGDIAMVWGPYQFRVGDQLSHCGHDLFHLTRDGGVWRLEGGAFTIRPDGCARLIGPRQVDSLPSRAPDATAAYGADRRQFGELRLPKGAGPFPVAVVMHGGCWQRQFASAGNTAALADALREAGFATWNIEYRTADEPGGGWPGTFHDVSDATDYLRTLARSHPIDTTRVIAVGHSAGGHLALWTAARPRLPEGSPLRRGVPLRVVGAVALGPVMDLGEFAARLPGTCGRGATMVVGGSPSEVPERHAAGTPIGLLPLRVPHAIVVGELDGILPVVPREAYVRRARAAGDDVRLTVVPEAGHFEVIAPTSRAWPLVLDQIRRLLPR